MSWRLITRGAPTGSELAEYECPDHGRFEASVPRPAPDEVPCSCGTPSSWRISAPGVVRVKAGEVVRGKTDALPGERVMMDTRPLADGMPLAEFKAQRAKVHRDISLARVRKMRR